MGFHHQTISSFRMYLLALRGFSLYHLLESHRLLCCVVSSRLHGYLLHNTMVIMVLVILVMISLILRKRHENSMLNSIMVVLRCWECLEIWSLNVSLVRQWTNNTQPITSTHSLTQATTSQHN